MRPVYIVFSFLFILSSCGSNEEYTSTIKQLNDQVEELKSQNQQLKRDLELCNGRIKEDDKPKETGIGVIGVWETPVIYGGGEVKIEKVNGKYFKTETFMDKSSSKKEMILENDGNSMVFREKGSQSSDRWVVRNDKSLEVRDKDGLIYSVK
jgi:hypothetical protein